MVREYGLSQESQDADNIRMFNMRLLFDRDCFSLIGVLILLCLGRKADCNKCYRFQIETFRHGPIG